MPFRFPFSVPILGAVSSSIFPVPVFSSHFRLLVKTLLDAVVRGTIRSLIPHRRCLPVFLPPFFPALPLLLPLFPCFTPFPFPHCCTLCRAAAPLAPLSLFSPEACTPGNHPFSKAFKDFITNPRSDDNCTLYSRSEELHESGLGY